MSPEELDAALVGVVTMGFSIGQDAAVSGALEMLGFGRVTVNIASAMNARVERLVKSQRLRWNEDLLVTT